MLWFCGQTVVLCERRGSLLDMWDDERRGPRLDMWDDVAVVEVDIVVAMVTSKAVAVSDWPV